MSEAANQVIYTAVGRRKTSTARVRLSTEGNTFKINGRDLGDFFPTELLEKTFLRPLSIVDKKDSVSIHATVSGGGPHGQASAISLGIARALLKLDPELRIPLKRDGLLRRDPRERERKKPGQPGARKRFQFSKR